MKTPLPLAVLAFVIGCGGSTVGPINTDGGTTDAATDGGGGGDGGGVCPSTEVGKSIYGSCFEAITLTKTQGGFGPPIPAGSECNVVGDVYVLDLVSGKLDRTTCVDPGNQQPYKQTKTTWNMTPGAVAGVVTALKAVVVVDTAGCVADGPTLMLVVKAKGKDVTYGDSKISGCLGTPVTGLDGVTTALQAK